MFGVPDPACHAVAPTVRSDTVNLLSILSDSQRKYHIDGALATFAAVCLIGLRVCILGWRSTLMHETDDDLFVTCTFIMASS